MKSKTICTLISACLLTLTCTMPAFGKMESPSYRIPAQVLDGGGSKSSSSSFSIIGAIGQSTAIGVSQGDSFHDKAGFIPQLSQHDDCSTQMSADENGQPKDVFDTTNADRLEEIYVTGTLPVPAGTYTLLSDQG